MFCTECGTRAADTAKFCANCGTKLLNKETVTENNTEVISATNTDGSENSDPIEIGSFFKSDPNYFGDLSNDVVIKAAEKGNTYAQWDMIRRCKAADDQTGLKIWNMVLLPERINRAKQGYFVDRIDLAQDYKCGAPGIEKNVNESDYWFKLAFDDCMKDAEQGDAGALCNLGTCFKYGYGRNEDIEEAIYWYEKAAEQGNISATWRLQEIYETETIQAYDKDTYEWVLKPFEFYDKQKADYWKKIHTTRYAEERKENFLKLKETAEQGAALDQYEVARRYLLGNEGVEKNIEAAELWFGRALSGFKKGAEQGNGRAQLWVGHCYRYGNGVQKDIPTAIMWYKKAAEQGNNHAMECISTWYHNEKNDYEERRWIEKAAENGNINALSKLAFEKSQKALKDLHESLSKYDFDAELNKAFAGFVESPMDKLGRIAKNALNDVDIVEVMSNPKVAIAKYGFNIVKEIFAENTKKEGLL